MGRVLKTVLLYGGVFAVVGVAGVVAMKIAKNTKDLKIAKEKAGEDAKKLFLIEGGTKVNPVKARTSPEFKDGRLLNNIIHEFERADKDTEIGTFVETIKDSNYKK